MSESAVTMASQSRLRTVSQQEPILPEASATNLSVIVLTHNEEANLPGCFESLRGLRCKVFVVDSGSTDRTIALAEAHGAAIWRHPFKNYAAQRNWSQDSLPVETPWLLHLDADERLTPELVAEINCVVQQPSLDIAGFLLRKRTIFMGRWIRYGGHYPSYHLRLFQTGKGRCEDRLYDQHFIVEGQVTPLKNDYLDVVASKLSTWTLRHCRWAEMEASEMLSPDSGGRRVSPDFRGNPIQRRRWWRNTYSHGSLFVRALVYWSYRYFLRLGFLDGREGLIFHFLQGFWFRFLVDALIFEKERVVPPSARS